jgi:hypothetical protein
MPQRYKNAPSACISNVYVENPMAADTVSDSDLSELKALMKAQPHTVRNALRQTSKPMPEARMNTLAGVYVPPRSVKGIKRITMKHRRMVAMHVKGHTCTEIAKMLGTSPGTVSVVLNNPTIRAVLQRIHAEFDGYIQDLKPLVYESLRDTLVHGTRTEKLKAIDRWGRITGEFKDTPMQDVSAEDVIQRALRIRHTGVDGSVTEVSYGERRNV